MARQDHINVVAPLRAIRTPLTLKLSYRKISMHDWAFISGATLSDRAFPGVLYFALLMAVQGTVVGAVVWWIAYRWRR